MEFKGTRATIASWPTRVLPVCIPPTAVLEIALECALGVVGPPRPLCVEGPMAFADCELSLFCGTVRSVYLDSSSMGLGFSVVTVFSAVYSNFRTPVGALIVSSQLCGRTDTVYTEIYPLFQTV